MTATLLFDMDGTIVETDHLHFEAMRSVFLPHGIDLDWETYRTRIIGVANVATAASFLPDLSPAAGAAVLDAKEAAYRALVQDLEAASGLLALLDWADRAGIRCAVVTNAPRANAELVLRALRLEDRFACLVIGDELANAKPHPLPYLTAIEALGGDPARSVAFEDSAAGARSAHAAGVGVVGLLTSVEPATLQAAGARVLARDFNDPELLAYVRERTGVLTA
ncbi:HAD family hydrolase [Aureimonas jatrophae]|uniref:Phosphoglycolate phosphatase n=1 Tax=Aureimonas jatrophae TaxID=1166073 RepID=A0A1H0FNY8_9HYPH|nr:HAD-IA family hydrolase [Aureimonas jatrophae]MBB3949926.1 HAD superfamily hydrolase (TIGR01509 family) [Aureimonas jatrophae]SDN96365.1 phosphoglycolate phosphatase [Aureimonas jatrophae]